MDTSLQVIDPKILALIKESFGATGLPKPFLQEIFLIDTHVAGTTHHNVKEIEPNLSINNVLIMKREAQNQYDPLAIMIFDEQGNKIGYVPKEKNEILARLMDAGKLIFGRIEEKAWLGNWLKIEVKIYMRDY